MVREIVLPETKPETEWILGRPVQKVSPTRTHSRLQSAFLLAIDAWGADRGQAGPEWRFRASPPGEDIRPLVPDVAYLSYERLRPLSEHDRELPPVPPEIVVEILSPDDREKRVLEKIRVYRAWGVDLILIVDPAARRVEVYERSGDVWSCGADEEMLTPQTFPDLHLPVRAIFGKVEIPSEKATNLLT
jgi:Uma2 family endonuclease